MKYYGKIVDNKDLITKEYADTKIIETKNYIDTSITNLIDSAPEELNTLNELASALGDDTNFAANVISVMATKYSKPNAGIPKIDLTAEVQSSLDKADASAPKTTTIAGLSLQNNISAASLKTALNVPTITEYTTTEIANSCVSIWEA